MVNAYLGLSENNSRRLYPGQPVNFVWGLSLGDLTENELHIDLGTARAEITSGEIGGAAIASATQEDYILDYRIVWPSKSEFSEPRVIGQIPQSIPIRNVMLPRQLYRQGRHIIQLQITGSGPDHGPYTSELSIATILENLNNSWWNWRTPQEGAVIPFGDRYTLSGIFTNNSLFSSKRISLELEQEVLNTEVPSMGGSVTINSSQNQEWQWLDPVTWTEPGPLSRTFSHSPVISQVQDQYGNIYPQLSITPRTVTVEVSREKLFNAELARANTVLALVSTALALAASASLITAAGGVIFGLAAIAFTSMAARAGELAMDPPEVDMNYNEVVKLSPSSMPKQLAETPTFFSISSILNSVEYILAGSSALKKIEGKCLGAIQGNDNESLRVQISNYNNIVDNIISHESKLPDLLTKAEVELNNNQFFSLVIIEKGLDIWKKVGLSADVHETLLKGGLTDEHLSKFKNLLENEYYKVQVLSPAVAFKTIVGFSKKLVDEIKFHKLAEL